MATCSVYDAGTYLRIEKNGRKQLFHKMGLGAEYIDNQVTLHDATGRTAILDADCCTYPGGCENGEDLQEKILEIVKRPFPIVGSFEHYVHLGKAYSISHIFENIAKDTERLILVKVGDTLPLHPIIVVNFGGQAFVYLYENPTIVTNGTPLAIYNLNRTSSNTADSQVFYGATVSAYGTLQLSSVFLPAGAGVRSVGGTIESPHYVWAKETDYLIRIINKSDATQNGSIEIYFYEEQ